MKPLGRWDSKDSVLNRPYLDLPLVEGALECGDLSPLLTGDLSPSNCADCAFSSGHRTLNAPLLADKSASGKSGDRSPHSKDGTAALRMAVMAVCLAAVCSVRAQTFSIDWFTIDGGGGPSSGGNFSLSGTIGQADANAQPMTGGDFSLTGGFWSLFVVQTPDAPLLNIHLTSANTALLSWPSPSTGFRLQENSDLNSTNWVNAPQVVSDNGTNKFITVSSSGGRRFYRLFKP